MKHLLESILGSSDSLPLRWDLFFQPMPLFFCLASLIALGLIYLLWQYRQKVDIINGPGHLGATDENLKEFFGWVPVILGIHVAVSLLVNGINGQLFAADHKINGHWFNWIGLAEILIALSLFYGGLTRAAAVILGFLWVIGLELFGIRPMLETIQYLGYAIFFYLAGRGPYAIDRILFPALEPNAVYASYALLAMRIGVGINFIVWAFTEKFANIPFVSSLLERFSFLNFTGISNETFVLIAGAVELLGGLLLVFGIFPRTVVILTLICINASLTIENWNAIVDYLPLYASLAILLVWEPDNRKQKLLWVEGLRKNMVDIEINPSTLR